MKLSLFTGQSSADPKSTATRFSLCTLSSSLPNKANSIKHYRSDYHFEALAVSSNGRRQFTTKHAQRLNSLIFSCNGVAFRLGKYGLFWN